MAAKIEITKLFDTFSELHISKVAERIGMNPSLLRQYTTGSCTPSKKQLMRIQEGLHQIGRELKKIRIHTN